MFWKKKRGTTATTTVDLEKYRFELGNGDDLMLRPPDNAGRHVVVEDNAQYKLMWQQASSVRIFCLVSSNKSRSVQKFQSLARMLTSHLSVNSDGLSCIMSSD